MGLNYTALSAAATAATALKRVSCLAERAGCATKSAWSASRDSDRGLAIVRFCSVGSRWDPTERSHAAATGRVAAVLRGRPRPRARAEWSLPVVRLERQPRLAPEEQARTQARTVAGAVPRVARTPARAAGAART